MRDGPAFAYGSLKRVYVACLTSAKLDPAAPVSTRLADGTLSSGWVDKPHVGMMVLGHGSMPRVALAPPGREDPRDPKKTVR